SLESYVGTWGNDLYGEVEVKLEARSDDGTELHPRPRSVGAPDGRPPPLAPGHVRGAMEARLAAAGVVHVRTGAHRYSGCAAPRRA
ncbi:MAG: hypothetical protein N2B05_09300, partial [Gemmatimonadales bacterium]